MGRNHRISRFGSCGKSHLNNLFTILAFSISSICFSSGRGPFFPSHRFPTDESFHFSFDPSFFTTSKNFTGPLDVETLTGGSSVQILRFSGGGEFQPNRRLSFGIQINVDNVFLSVPSQASTYRKSGLSDQVVWSEFRFFDKPGASFGLAVIGKFPLYQNPTLEELDPDNPPPTAFLGDAQTDISTIVTSEFWPHFNLRLRTNLGYTYRASDFGGELPFFLSLGYVTPKIDIELRMRGNLALKSTSSIVSESEQKLNDLRAVFQNSKYALSDNPWHLIFEPKFEFWISPSHAVQFRYSTSWMGNRSASFNEFSLGFVYRWAQKKLQRQKTFQQVDIRTDQEAGVFQGESQERSAEPKIVDPSPIKEGSENDEEFF
jgi:hypothetical protein